MSNDHNRPYRCPICQRSCGSYSSLRLHLDEHAVVKRVDDPITALAALYQGEKADASHLFNTVVEMSRLTVAYIIGAVLLTSKSGGEQLSWLFWLLSPLPIWLIAAFHCLMTLNAMSHGISVRIIEDALFEAAGLPLGERDLVGSAAGDNIMDITQAKAVHKLAASVVWGCFSFLTVGFTVYALYSANGIIEHNVTLVHARVSEIAMGVYLLLAIMVCVSWVEGLRVISRGVLVARNVLGRQPDRERRSTRQIVIEAYHTCYQQGKNSFSRLVGLLR